MASVSSMTGYATAQGKIASGFITVELRSVNSRFLDLTLRIPDELRGLEAPFRELIYSRVKRGKLECRVSFKADALGRSAKLDPGALEALSRLEEEAIRAFPGARPLSVAELLAYPGVLSTDTPDPELVQSGSLAILGTALDSFSASRVREGTALSRVLLGYCDNIEAIARAIAGKLPEILAAMKAKLEERMQEALTAALSEKSTLTPDDVNERIRSELTLYALRMDVAEEINRLLTHVAEVRRTLSAGGPVGRRLDFLMQELNREANTLGSKAVAIEMTNASLELKLNIEKMREQIQNLE